VPSTGHPRNAPPTRPASGTRLPKCSTAPVIGHHAARPVRQNPRHDGRSVPSPLSDSNRRPLPYHLGTVIKIDIDRGDILIAADRGEQRLLDHTYAAAHLEHAYALTGHGAQGATVTWVGAIGRPEEFTKEWAYTALSRATHQTTIHIVAEHSEQERERDGYAPAAPDRSVDESIDGLHRAIRRTETERLAAEQHPQPNSPEIDGASMLRGRLNNAPRTARR
jgi:hypothetical protein